MGSGRESFEQNVRAELAAGKPRKQALAIAYDVQRRSRKGQRKRKG